MREWLNVRKEGRTEWGKWQGKKWSGEKRVIRTDRKASCCNATHSHSLCNQPSEAVWSHFISVRFPDPTSYQWSETAVSPPLCGVLMLCVWLSRSLIILSVCVRQQGDSLRDENRCHCVLPPGPRDPLLKHRRTHSRVSPRGRCCWYCH